MLTISEAISYVFTGLNNDQKKEILNVLVHIIQKIIDNPTRAKFRFLKKDSQTFINKFLCFKGSENILKAVGFEEDAERWFFPVSNDGSLVNNLNEVRNYIKNNAYTIYNNTEHIFEQSQNSPNGLNNHTNGNSNNSNTDNSKLGDKDKILKPRPDGLTLGSLSKRRLEKERNELLRERESTIKLIQEDSDKWIIQIKGAENTLYSNETFKMQFKFTDKYPIESPEVIFIGQPPIHPHIYSNGHICLSILYDNWSPVLSVNSICLSIISMLSSCTKKKKPIDDMLYCSAGSKVSPKNMRWMFHDDKV
ncbi:ubiquitin-conjugating enzyme E2, putative [Plasmodium chabaudi chabaudi]|uniref:Ubiquitin-conjugating enzyme E2, putative n=1 Tax=Plasmodium chabaudi chabaudi TaxID=31271 RepID=A0A4V0K1B5_PLACU|nr:ubiquitin-conjugating enzyme E2, putative [Plasmodium chabaudi chabaudi]VTZ66641.1 ubiquitin-conjugating enzyme E2, putative [Plasmodium chabaudi chabaudi]|eukprot:XP_016655634.1 ubiquitin-conjugating enzyme, putative [Plasmodium chabaudi chabaudi]